jgi:hypothetical protein
MTAVSCLTRTELNNDAARRAMEAWPTHVASAVLHVISLAQFATAYTRGWAANSVNARIRLKAKLDRANEDNVKLREEIRIKDARMGQISPYRRPHYPPTERMAILELRAARGWAMQKTAEVFILTPATIASWMKRLDEQGPDALVQTREPVNRFAAIVAILLVGSCRCRPLLTTRHGFRRFQSQPKLGIRPSVHGQNDPCQSDDAEVHHQRQRPSVLVRWLQGMVQEAWHQTTVWSH